MLISLLERFGENASVNPNHVTSVETGMVPSVKIGERTLGSNIWLIGRKEPIPVRGVTADEVTMFLNANEGEAGCLSTKSLPPPG